MINRQRRIMTELSHRWLAHYVGANKNDHEKQLYE